MKKITTFVLLLLAFNSQAQNFEWRPIVPGIDCDDSVVIKCLVRKLVVDTQRNVLWMIGLFDGAGGIISPNAIGFDGTDFIAFPGVMDSFIAVHIRDGIMYNGDLIVGGSDNNVYKYDFNTLQHSIIGTFSNDVLCLSEYNGDLIAGGGFYNGVAKWNGSQWDTLGGGLWGSSHIVYDLENYNGKLYAGGAFEYAGDTDAWNIASWDGSTWQNLCSSGGSYGTDDLDGNHGAAVIHDMEVFDNKLYITGQFEKVCGDTTYLAYWDDTTWHGTSYGGEGVMLISVNNRLIIKSLTGGPYLYYTDNVTTTGVDTGFAGGDIDEAVFQNTLYAGGGFSNSGATLTFRIARLMDIGNGINGIGNASGIKIYPNPAQSEITIETSDKTSVQIIVKDLLGRELLAVNSNSSKTTMDISALSAGVYLLQVQSKNGSIQIAKFINE